jgi:hypothetical protein
MFAREINALDDYRGIDIVEPSSEARSAWNTRLKRMIDDVYPAIEQHTRVKRQKMEEAVNASRKILEEIEPGTEVLAKDVTRTSKWDPHYEGPFTVIRRNKGGAYLLQDADGEKLERKFPVEQLKVLQRTDNMSKEPVYKIKRLTDHRDNSGKTEYLVEWDVPGLLPTWEPEGNILNPASIKKYWKDRGLVTERGSQLVGGDVVP